MAMVVIKLSHSFDVSAVMLLCRVHLVHLRMCPVSLAKGHLLGMFHRRPALAGQLVVQECYKVNCPDCRNHLSASNCVQHLLVEEDFAFCVAPEFYV